MCDDPKADLVGEGRVDLSAICSSSSLRITPSANTSPASAVSSVTPHLHVRTRAHTRARSQAVLFLSASPPLSPSPSLSLARAPSLSHAEGERKTAKDTDAHALHTAMPETGGRHADGLLCSYPSPRCPCAGWSPQNQRRRREPPLQHGAARAAPLPLASAAEPACMYMLCVSRCSCVFVHSVMD